MSDSGPEPGEIAAIVLAAGTSSRFGSNKLLHPLTQRGVTMPLAAHSLLSWLEAFGHIHVVVKPGAEAFCSEVEAALRIVDSGQIRWIVCAEAASGLASSLACGVLANHDAAAGWIIGLADMPAVPSAALIGVRNALKDGAIIAAPYLNNRRGHPVGFSGQYYNELIGLQGDVGARHLLERDILSITHVKIDDAGIFADIDIPSDLQRVG